MSRPPPEADPKTMHPAPPAASPAPPAPSAALIEAYKKHALELSGIEDRQSKLTVLLLGVFSGAASVLLVKGAHLDCPQKVYVSLVALMVMVVGQHVINELHDLRIAVRDLLVRCEIGLRFYEVGTFLAGQPLYTDYEAMYATRGGWTKQYFLVVWLVALGFVGSVIFKS